MPHPQQQELEVALTHFLDNPSGSLEVALPDPEAAAEELASSIQATIEFVHLDRPTMRVQLGSAEREAAARMLGFEFQTRTARPPFGGGTVEIPYAQRPLRDAADGVKTCLEWLQHAQNLNDAWLWITALEYDEWPDPLPKPAVWPPAG